MYEYHNNFNDFASITIKIPSQILSNTELTNNQKIILGLDYTLSLKKGFNKLTNIQISKMLNIHPNIVCKSRKSLVNQNYLKKEKTIYQLTDKYKSFKVKDKRQIILVDYIYTNKHLSTGSKLLWGEYNSFCRTNESYFGSREFTSVRLGCSKESISNWTKELLNEGLIDYQLKSGYCTKQKVVVTKDIPNIK